MLENDSDAGSGRIDGLPVDQHVSGARREKTTDAAQQSCLAAARWTDYAENLSVADLQINIAKGDNRSFEEKLTRVIHHNLGAVSHSSVSRFGASESNAADATKASPACQCE